MQDISAAGAVVSEHAKEEPLLPPRLRPQACGVRRSPASAVLLHAVQEQQEGDSWIMPGVNPCCRLMPPLCICTCRYTLDGEERFARRISMIAGGTGITPMYQARLLLAHACLCSTRGTEGRCCSGAGPAVQRCTGPQEAP